jgi:hypothetical protein
MFWENNPGNRQEGPPDLSEMSKDNQVKEREATFYEVVNLDMRKESL